MRRFVDQIGIPIVSQAFWLGLNDLLESYTGRELKLNSNSQPV